MKIMVIWNDGSAETIEDTCRETYQQFCNASTVHAVSLYDGLDHLETHVNYFGRAQLSLLPKITEP